MTVRNFARIAMWGLFLSFICHFLLNDYETMSLITSGIVLIAIFCMEQWFKWVDISLEEMDRQIEDLKIKE